MNTHIIEVTRTDGNETFVRLTLADAMQLIEYESMGSRFISCVHHVLALPLHVMDEITATIEASLTLQPWHQQQTEPTTQPSG